MTKPDPMGDRLNELSLRLDIFKQIVVDYEGPGPSDPSSLAKEIRLIVILVADILKRQQQMLVLLEHEIEELKK